MRHALLSVRIFVATLSSSGEVRNMMSRVLWMCCAAACAENGVDISSSERLIQQKLIDAQRKFSEAASVDEPQLPTVSNSAFLEVSGRGGAKNRAVDATLVLRPPSESPSDVARAVEGFGREGSARLAEVKAAYVSARERMLIAEKVALKRLVREVVGSVARPVSFLERGGRHVSAASPLSGPHLVLHVPSSDIPGAEHLSSDMQLQLESLSRLAKEQAAQEGELSASMRAFVQHVESSLK